MVNNFLQAVGLALVAVFCWFVWPPLPLLVTGLALVVGAEVREVRARRETPKGGDAR